MSTNTTLPNWAGGDGTNVYASGSQEPSGIVFATANNTDFLYMVSDNGYIFAQNQNDGTWDSDHYGDDDAHDYESVAMVTGKLMIGVEGGVSDGNGGYSSPIIQRFDPSNTDSKHDVGTFTKSTWTLDGMNLGSGGGMEGMTFIPQEDCPESWGTASYYGGFFLVAVQSHPGRIFVYDLPQGGGKDQTVPAPVTSFTDTLLPLKISDMYYSPEKKRLIVLFDDTASSTYPGNNGSNYVGVIQSLENAFGKFQEKVRMRTQYVGSEGVTYRGDDLYIALDQSGSKTSSTSQWGANGLTENLITRYPDFNLG